jgi:hypothetical protein
MCLQNLHQLQYQGHEILEDSVVLSLLTVTDVGFNNKCLVFLREFHFHINKNVVLFGQVWFNHKRKSSLKKDSFLVTREKPTSEMKFKNKQQQKQGYVYQKCRATSIYAIHLFLIKKVMAGKM